VSGLETAIRNALERSNRADREIRTRIYQSARQALDAGLRKQGVTDRLIIMQQHERLEEKIHEIEMEELQRQAQPQAPEITVEQPPEPVHVPEAETVEPPAVEAIPHAAARAAPEAEVMLGGETRLSSPAASQVVLPAGPAPSVTPATAAGAIEGLGDFGATRSDRIEVERAEVRPGAKKEKAKPAKTEKTAAPSSGTGLDVPPERAAKPRKRRGFLSHLLTWILTLAVVGGACWWFYRSGMVQSFIEEAMKAAERPSGSGQGSGEGPIAFDPRSGFSDDWVEIFVPSKVAEMKPGPQARVEAVDGSEGRAVRIISATPGEGGDVAIDVPPEVLREMAGKSSTVALTLQSGQDRSTQLSVRCDFGSLGVCGRHRFTASQEKLEALFRVAFDRSLAPNRPGQLIINSGIDGADRPVLLYSVRILPGQ